ncbi:MAG: AbrB/MazE/SpoVT family DNA-binding domain-containing protein [Propionibacteriaceae bacterium]|nr:AbrB/MazE/SpoVT family DNA-binding domain-containing protein [Propionibacteriaceae bacterium]
MDVLYSTISTKGQITLPAEIRRELGLKPGQKVGMSVKDGSVVIAPPVTLDDVRSRLRAAAEASGTWGTQPRAGEGWAAHVREHYGES